VVFLTGGFSHVDTFDYKQSLQRDAGKPVPSFGLRPDETAPYEKRLLEDLDRLNRKISELQGPSDQPLSLNERPEK
jgi:hypothetical protein